jgi:hypothetical protein
MNRNCTDFGRPDSTIRVSPAQYVKNIMTRSSPIPAVRALYELVVMHMTSLTKLKHCTVSVGNYTRQMLTLRFVRSIRATLINGSIFQSIRRLSHTACCHPERGTCIVLFSNSGSTMSGLTSSTMGTQCRVGISLSITFPFLWAGGETRGLTEPRVLKGY